MEIIDFSLDVLYHSYENSFITFLSGILFILCLYHLILYFQQRIIAYLYYSIYVFFLFFSIAPFATGFLKEEFSAHHDLVNKFIGFSAEMAFVIYFFFALSFLNLKEADPKWYRIILYGAYIFGGATIIFELAYLISGDPSVGLLGYEVLMIYVTPLFALVSYYPIIRLKTPLKYYIIVGSLLVFASSAITDAMAFFSGRDRYELTIYYSIYFICIVIEASLFSFGLGHKQKKMLKQNKESQDKIIAQYRENEKLKETVQQKLEENLRLMSEEAEQERFQKLKVNYEKELAEMKVTALKSQMNPHFIFNSLNSIKLYIIDNDKDNAVYYLNKFSKLIRKILSSTRVKTISLAEELEIMKLYISIENIRFEDDIDFEIIVPSELNTDTVQLPSMILQPFIENAIWHGLPSKKGKKWIRLAFSSNHESLQVTIEDNGIGRKRANELKQQKIHKNKSVGINLIKERLRNFSRGHSNTFSMDIIDLYDDRGVAAGTKVVLEIPLKQNFSLS